MAIGSLIKLVQDRITLTYGQQHLVGLGSLTHPALETWFTPGFTLEGIPTQDKRLYEAKQTTKVSLRLTYNEFCEWDLFYYLHKEKIRERRIPWVQFVDQRIPITEVGSRSRAIAPGTAEISSSPRQYYPVYRVSLEWDGNYQLLGSQAGIPVFQVDFTVAEVEKPIFAG